MLADVDLDLRGEKIATERTRIHRRVNLFAIGHQSVTGQWVVMLPAHQLTNAPDGAVDGSQPGTVALPPDQALMVGRADLAATLNQGAVGIKQQLRVIDRAAIALIDANRHHHPGLLAGFADGAGGGRRHRH